MEMDEEGVAETPRGAVALAVTDDCVVIDSGGRKPELAEDVGRDEQEEEQEEYDADAVATLLWPDDTAPQRDWIDGPIEQHVFSSEPRADSPSARSRRSSGSIVDALVNASIADPEQIVECDALRSQAEHAEQRRQLDALELQLAKLEAEKRVLCSELGPSRPKPKAALSPSRLRVSAASVTLEDDGPVASNEPANHHSSDCPSVFICPITQEIFRYPVIASDGHSYEREAIETWLVSTNVAPTSPVTNLPLPTSALFPNHGLRSQVLEWKEKEGLPSDDRADGAHSEQGYAGLMESRRPSLPDTDSDTQDTDYDDDRFDLAVTEALRRSILDQRQQLPWHSPWPPAGGTSHAAELMRARRARGLRPAFGSDTTGSPTIRVDLSAGSGDTERRSSACTVM
eukprot:COSAG02_NODE_493_length_21166_cov_13.181318_7_plen_400_part_00